ncbi:hypothetical protein E2986_08484 [Frieseomelitta varia]|uniref:Uncharacterized protein n=1 Tax=Frieseomelitta varia TaxID=561572 RepID=A0A833W6K7_9HYME|nr:uncharacterized protein LOC122535364 [Frieseomelitta varia]KAF3422458.1 hypothetical protein E2986_08484 [Frieseomelitta varia]
MFLPESDNESVPSPVKPQPRVPYCKTYEEIRLEEIQAESAAYYSYQAEGSQSDIGDGNIKARRTKRISQYPPANKDSNDRKGLDFEVLTLDEIRRRKRKSFEEAKTGNSEAASSTELLNDTVESLAGLTETISARGVKRRLNENFEQDASKRRRKMKCPNDRDAISSGIVPPVKLRRSPKRLGSLQDEERDARTDQEQQLEEKRDESGRNNPESSSMARLNESESSSSTSRPRKNEVEVRLCDSSTDEDQVPLERSKQKNLQSVNTVEDSKEADSLLNINEEDYLTLDMASDDILNDIDALLKDKTSVWRKG